MCVLQRGRADMLFIQMQIFFGTALIYDRDQKFADDLGIIQRVTLQFSKAFFVAFEKIIQNIRKLFGSIRRRILCIPI